MGGAVEAGKLCHLVDFQPEVVQVLLRLFNPGVVDVLLHGNPQVFLEQAAEIRLTDHQVVGDLIERDVAAAQILPDIIRRLANQVVFLVKSRLSCLQLLLEVLKETLRFLHGFAGLKLFHRFFRRLSLLQEKEAHHIGEKVLHPHNVQVLPVVLLQPLDESIKSGKDLRVLLLRHTDIDIAKAFLDFRAAHRPIRLAHLLDKEPVRLKIVKLQRVARVLERLRQCREFRDGAADTVAGVSIQIILEHGVEFSNILEVSTMDLLIEFAKIGMGAACVIQEFVQEELDRGDLITLPLDLHFLQDNRIRLP